ncbi:MAG: YcxB family protein [Ruminococcaceae bacterium]|nr:YcxB family protein [Oscillospiraceae bacterium]
MVFKTDLTERDFIGLNWLMSKSSTYLFSVMLGLFFGGTLYAKMPDKLLQLILLAVVLFGVALTLGYIYIQRRSVSIYRRADVSDELKLVLDDKGIVQTSNSGETELLWEDVFSVRKNRECYFVFLNPKQAFYFPKRNFEPNQEAIFLELLGKSVDPKKMKI